MCLTSNWKTNEKVKKMKRETPNKVITCWKVVNVDFSGNFAPIYQSRRAKTYNKIKNKDGEVQAFRLGKALTNSNLTCKHRRYMTSLYINGGFCSNFYVDEGIHVFGNRQKARDNCATGNKVVKAQGLVKDLIAISRESFYTGEKEGDELVFIKVKMPTTLEEAKETKTLSR